MSRLSKISPAALLLGMAMPLTSAPGCGGPEAIPVGKAASIPVHNPSPDNPLKDVTLENEHQFKGKIGGISK
jgi:hypothetical protein